MSPVVSLSILSTCEKRSEVTLVVMMGRWWRYLLKLLKQFTQNTVELVTEVLVNRLISRIHVK